MKPQHSNGDQAAWVNPWGQPVHNYKLALWCSYFIDIYVYKQFRFRLCYFALIDSNSIQKTSILKVVSLLSCGQTWQSMNSDFFTSQHHDVVISASFWSIYCNYITTKSVHFWDHTAVVSQINSANVWLSRQSEYLLILTHQLWNCHSPETDGEVNIHNKHKWSRGQTRCHPNCCPVHQTEPLFVSHLQSQGCVWTPDF